MSLSVHYRYENIHCTYSTIVINTAGSYVIHIVIVYCTFVEAELYVTNIINKLSAQFYIELTVGIIFFLRVWNYLINIHLCNHDSFCKLYFNNNLLQKFYDIPAKSFILFNLPAKSISQNS